MAKIKSNPISIRSTLSAQCTWLNCRLLEVPVRFIQVRIRSIEEIASEQNIKSLHISNQSNTTEVNLQIYSLTSKAKGTFSKLLKILFQARSSCSKVNCARATPGLFPKLTFGHRQLHNKPNSSRWDVCYKGWTHTLSAADEGFGRKLHPFSHKSSYLS